MIKSDNCNLRDLSECLLYLTMMRNCRNVKNAVLQVNFVLHVIPGERNTIKDSTARIDSKVYVTGPINRTEILVAQAQCLTVPLSQQHQLHLLVTPEFLLQVYLNHQQAHLH